MTETERRAAMSIIREWPEVARAVREVLDEQDLERAVNQDARRRELPMELRSVPGVVVRSKHEGDR